MELELTTLIFLWFIAFLAGFLDSIAGGGGLLTVPALSFTAIDPSMILGTNKLQSVFGTFSSSLKFIRSKEVLIKEIALAFLLSLAGGAAGSIVVQQINSDFLRPLILFMLIGISLFFLFSPKLKDEDQKPRVSSLFFALIFGFLIGFYDGFFGPGTGTFFVLAFMFFRGFSLRNASLRGRMLNFSSNLGSFVLFAIGGKIFWSLGLVMASGQFLGARIGAHFVLTKGTKIIRPLIIVTSITMSAKLLYNLYLS